MEITTSSFAEAYSILRKELLQAPEIAPRGLKTKELLGVTIHLTNPRNRLGFHPDRHYSLPLAITESIMLFSDSDRLEHLEYISPILKQYSDTGKTLHGSYGNRIHTHIQDILRKFEEDESTRQAILPIIRPYDLRVVTKDFPCNLLLNLLIRDNKLHLFVFARSIDFSLGFQYDTFVFCTFLEILANTLNLEIGELHYSITSLHVYEDYYQKLNNIETMRPIEFKVDYQLKDMPRLISLIEELRFLQDESKFEDTGFDHILQAFWRKKQHLYYKPMPITEFSFADQFLRYELKEERKTA